MESTEARAVEIRSRLAEIHDQQTALPEDDFAGKHELATEADALRAELGDLAGDDLEAATSEWAERAGRKGAHEQNVDALKAMIANQSESGGSGG